MAELQAQRVPVELEKEVALQLSRSGRYFMDHPEGAPSSLP